MDFQKWRRGERTRKGKKEIEGGKVKERDLEMARIPFLQSFASRDGSGARIKGPWGH